MIRVRVDFNSMTADRRKVPIWDETAISALYPGLRIMLFEPDDFEVEAVAEPETQENGDIWWFAVIDWSTSRDLPAK